jgi:hypothetical protein
MISFVSSNSFSWVFGCQFTNYSLLITDGDSDFDSNFPRDVLGGE